jgi:hypothetical protein
MRDQDTTRLRDCTLALVDARRRLAAGPTAAEATALRARIKGLSADILDLSLLATADAAHETGHFDDETMLRATIARNKKDRPTMMTFDNMGPPLPGNAELRRDAAMRTTEMMAFDHTGRLDPRRTRRVTADDVSNSGQYSGGAKVLVQVLPGSAAEYSVEASGEPGRAALYRWSTTAAGPGDLGRNFRPTRESSMSGAAAEQIFDNLAVTEAEKAQSIFDRARQYERTSDAARWRQSSMARASDEAVQRRAIHNRNVLNRKKYGFGPSDAA